MSSPARATRRARALGLATAGVAQLHEDVEAAVLVLHLVEGAVEGQGRSPRLVAQALRRIDVDPAPRIQDADDESQGDRGSPAQGGEPGDVGGDAVDFLARVREVSGAGPHEHLDAAGGGGLEGCGDLVERRCQPAARQVPADLDAVGAPVAGPAGAQWVLDADLDDGHGAHLP